MPNNELYIELKFPGMNEYSSANRTNKQVGAAMKKKYTNIVSIFAKQQLRIDKNGFYDLEIEWQTKDNRRDADNIFTSIKFLIDGCVEAGVLENDSRKFIRHISNKIYTTGKDAVNLKFIKVIKVINN